LRLAKSQLQTEAETNAQGKQKAKNKVRKSCPNREEGGDQKSESISKAALQSKIPDA
jgi:hypothetical protein